MYKIPNEWTKGVIWHIFKEGNRWDCNNQRGISLLNVAYKVCARIITWRLSTIHKCIFSEEQCGFLKGSSCYDCIFLIKQLIQKRREFNLPTYTLFIDYEEVFVESASK
jgi:hypothetical protein